MLPAGSLRVSAYQRGEASLPRVWSLTRLRMRGVLQLAFSSQSASGGVGNQKGVEGKWFAPW